MSVHHLEESYRSKQIRKLKSLELFGLQRSSNVFGLVVCLSLRLHPPEKPRTDGVTTPDFGSGGVGSGGVGPTDGEV